MPLTKNVSKNIRELYADNVDGYWNNIKDRFYEKKNKEENKR